ncbi:MAG: HEAT repeat domain-containing protein [Gemmataceae bacterium]
MRRAALLLALVSSLAAAQDSDPVVDGKKASEWFSTLRNDPSPRKRAQAAAALGPLWLKHQHKDALPDLVRSMKVDTSAAVRAQCVRTFGSLPPDTAAVLAKEVSAAFAEEKEAAVRKELALALSRFPDVAKKAVEPLSGVLKDPDPLAKVAAAEALARAGKDAKDSADDLLPLLDDKEKPVRQAAVFALGRVGPDNPSFVAAALAGRFGREPDVEVRREVVGSLKLLGDKSDAVVAMLAGATADADAETRTGAVRTLGSFGPPAKAAADPLLKAATANPDKAFREDAVRAFAAVLGPDGLKARAADVVKVMEADPEFEVRLAAVEELGALGTLAKGDALITGALRARQSDPQVKVRQAAAAAVRRIEKKVDPKEPGKK